MKVNFCFGLWSTKMPVAYFALGLCSKYASIFNDSRTQHACSVLFLLLAESEICGWFDL